MKKNKTSAVNFIAAVFIFLFTYTALSKLLSFASFHYTLSRSPLIGDYSSLVAVVLPALELIVAVLLFLSKTRRIGLYASLGLMILFTIYIGYALMSDSKLPCSCGGVFQSLNWWEHLWVNLFLTMLAALAVRLQSKISQQESKFLLQ